MYSGMFTHYIKPVMSVAQIEKMFGLLGYQFSSTRQEQLQLQVLRAGPAFLEELLRLSCAFFLARCECRLLLTALGKRSSDAQWALSVVRERQRGHNLRVSAAEFQTGCRHLTVFSSSDARCRPPGRRGQH